MILRGVIVLLLLISTVLRAEGVRVEGTTLIVDDDQGGQRRGSDLDGAELDLGDLGTLRLLRTERDADARFPDQVWLLQAELRAASASAFANFCPPDPKGDARMVIYQGYLDGQLHYVNDPTRFSLSCTSGVEAKCLRWGYLPWRSAPDGTTALAPYFETCIRLARADYCGNDQPTTRNGTSIDVYDRVGIQQRTPDLPDFKFEAGWGPQGAVCVHHARIPENLELAKLPALCARLTVDQLGPVCDEAAAEAAGALIFNRSLERTASGE